jgi:hypothetical protein
MATHSEWEQQRQQRKAEAKETLLKLAEPLAAAGYRYLVGFFDGSGDDGNIGKVLACRAEADDDGSVNAARFDGDVVGDPVPESIAAGRLETDIGNAIWELTPDGFENSAGGFGAVILDAQEGKVKVNYSYRVDDSVEADYEV